MCETSPNYHHLQLALASAGNLIKTLHPHLIKTDHDDLMLRSYVLICHAALEEYLEGLSVWVLKECRKSFFATGIISHPLLCLSGFYSFRDAFSSSDDVGPHTIRQSLLRLCDAAIEKHEIELEGVHGIKTKDQEAIFMPLGMNLHGFNSDLSWRLNQLGAARGEMAHTFRIKQKLPRIAQEKNMAYLITNLLAFDNEMCARVKRSAY